ncbi:unnamed protein product [[Candida] boidinii]|nr:unnamed protein product [[Candida] boidinii]
MLPRRKSLKLLLTCLIVLVACSIIILEYIQVFANDPPAIIDYKSGKDKNNESDINKSNSKVSEILNSVNEKLTDYYNNNFNTDNKNNNKINNFKNYKIPENLDDILNIIDKVPDQVDLQDQVFIKNRKNLVDDNIRQLHNIINEKISEPKVDNLIRQSKQQESEQIDKNSGIDVDLTENDSKDRANAAIVALVRNQELKQLMTTITLFEEKFNKKFRYPYVFLNNRKFSEKFKEEITKICSGDVYFEYIEPELWDQPESIDKSEQSLKMYELKQKGIQYASLVPNFTVTLTTMFSDSWRIIIRLMDSQLIFMIQKTQ